ncbi:DUF6952 family protein [Bergeyella porcorum]|uniref:Uncharacterized protein n=1 Tax=Bergeyella porcorum TaxID=1735111 RepID=A0AAU0F0V4_9FLAO
MKLPIIRQFYQNQSVENLEKTLEVLEAFTEFRGATEEDLNVAGELITNICGALEVHANVANGMSEKDALNGFAQKVMGSIDR